MISSPLQSSSLPRDSPLPSSSSPSSPYSNQYSFFDSSLRSGSSRNTMNADLCVSPDATPQPLDAQETLFSKPGTIQPAGGATRQFIHHKMYRKHSPYPPQSAFPTSPEVGHSAQMGPGCQPKFSLEKTQNIQYISIPNIHANVIIKDAEQLERGLSQMSTSTVYKGY